MLVRDVPGFGFGLAAGLPTYPWWFGCDSSYAFWGRFRSACLNWQSNSAALARYSQSKRQRRIMHEVVTNGCVQPR